MKEEVKFEIGAKYDESSYNYAKRMNVEYLFADKYNGKVWQFLSCRSLKAAKEKSKELKCYPHMRFCIPVKRTEYYKYFTGRNEE